MQTATQYEPYKIHDVINPGISHIRGNTKKLYRQALYMIRTQKIQDINFGLRPLMLAEAAIESSRGFFPETRTLRALLLYDANFPDEAETEAKRAIWESPYQFEAAWLLAMINVKRLIGINSWLPASDHHNRNHRKRHTQPKKPMASKRNIKRDMSRYANFTADIFNELVSHSISGDKFIKYADKLIELADIIYQHSLPYNCCKLLGCIEDVNMDKVQFYDEVSYQVSISILREVSKKIPHYIFEEEKSYE